MDQLFQSGGNQLLSQGLVGVICIFLLWYIGRLQQELKDLRAEHKAEIATKDKALMDQVQARLVEQKYGFEIAASTKTALEVLLSGNRSRQ